MDTNTRRCEACGTDISHLVQPTGRPRQYCEHADCKRERNRAYVRKHRGTQRVLLRWTEPRLLTWRERARRRLYRLSDAVTVEAEGSIVDLDLSRERDPADKAQALLDDFVTDWLVGCGRREWRCKECDGPWRKAIGAFRIEVKYCSPACRQKARKVAA